MAVLISNCATQKKTKTITTKELKTILDTKEIQLLDVRTPEEVGLGIIKDAKVINYFDEDFTEKSIDLIDKNKPVYVYCRTGNRSGKACEILKEQGLDVINVEGGFSQWETEN